MLSAWVDQHRHRIIILLLVGGIISKLRVQLHITKSRYLRQMGSRLSIEGLIMGQQSGIQIETILLLKISTA